MSWKVRHEGSPRAVEDLTLTQVAEGLQDGLWEPTDQVMGPQDQDWVAIENHPQLAEVALDIEPPPPPFHEDESRIDMNALIDVCLVLLIFFMLTVTYLELEKHLGAPKMTRDSATGQLVVTKNQVKETMIRLNVNEENGAPVFLVEDKPVKEADLEGELRRFVSTSHKTQLFVEYGPGVRHEAVIAVQDAATGAGIQGINVHAPGTAAPAPGPKPPPREEEEPKTGT